MPQTNRPRFGIATAPHAGRATTTSAGLARGRRDPGDRARVAVRPPDADRRRPERADLRGLDAALGPRRTDRTAAPRPAGDQQPLPAAGDAGQDRGDRRRRLRRTARLRHRRRAHGRPPARPARVRGARAALPRLRRCGGSLAEACTVIRRLWTEAEPFDFDGTYIHSDRSVLQPQAGPAAVSADHDRRTHGRDAARGRRACRPVEHPGRRPRRRHPAKRAARPLCAEIGRDPASITRSIHLRVSYDGPARPGTRSERRSTTGFVHIVLGLPAPYPDDVARWVADELITKSV